MYIKVKMVKNLKPPRSILFKVEMVRNGFALQVEDAPSRSGTGGWGTERLGVSLGMRCLARAPIVKKCPKIKNVSREMFLSQSKRVKKIIKITDQRANARPAQCAKCTPQGSCCSASSYLPHLATNIGGRDEGMWKWTCFSVSHAEKDSNENIEMLKGYRRFHMRNATCTSHHEPIQPWPNFKLCLVKVSKVSGSGSKVVELSHVASPCHCASLRWSSVRNCSNLGSSCRRRSPARALLGQSESPVELVRVS